MFVQPNLAIRLDAIFGSLTQSEIGVMLESPKPSRTIPASVRSALPSRSKWLSGASSATRFRGAHCGGAEPGFLPITTRFLGGECRGAAPQRLRYHYTPAGNAFWMAATTES